MSVVIRYLQICSQEGQGESSARHLHVFESPRGTNREMSDCTRHQVAFHSLLRLEVTWSDKYGLG